VKLRGIPEIPALCKNPDFHVVHSSAPITINHH
jgi:hypothetical protein